MAISAPIRNCRRLSGYPFSLTREMSIRFFGYFASELRERTGNRRSRDISSRLLLSIPSNRTPNKRSKYLCRPLPSSSPLPALFLPPLIGRSPLRSPMHLLTLAPGPLARISHITFRILSFSAAFFPRAGSSTLLSRKLFGFPLLQREIAREPTTSRIYRTKRAEKERERDSSPHTEDVSSFGNQPIRVLRSFHCKRLLRDRVVGSYNCFGC